MTFTPISLSTWTRGQMFYYFSKMAPTGYSLTVSMDVTKLRASLKQHGIKFFPAYLWLVTRNLNHQVEFKVAEQDGVLGYFDTLTPLYATFHEDDKHARHVDGVLGILPGISDAYLQNQKQFGDTHGVLCQPQTPPPANAYTVSCMPWVHFSHFAVHSFENKPYYFPSVEAGKFTEENGRFLMPLSITCHHATTDGYHIHTFLDALQADMDQFEAFL